MEGYFMQTCITKGCGISWFQPSGLDTQRRKDHLLFYCPNGHGQYYPELNSEEKLQNQLDETIRLKNRLAEEKERCCKQAETLRHKMNGLRGYISKLKKSNKKR